MRGSTMLSASGKRGREARRHAVLGDAADAARHHRVGVGVRDQGAARPRCGPPVRAQDAGDEVGERALAVAGRRRRRRRSRRREPRGRRRAAACRHGPAVSTPSRLSSTSPSAASGRPGGTISWPHISLAISADVVVRGRLDMPGDPAVAQHHAAVGQRADLVELVRDEDDAEALARPSPAAPRRGRRPRRA